MNSRRDEPVPAMHEFETGRVGATLAVARLKTLHEFETGRDKPVPYSVRKGGHDRLNFVPAP